MYQQVKNDSIEFSLYEKKQESLVNHLIKIIEDTLLTDSIKVEAVYLLAEQKNYLAIKYLLLNINRPFPPPEDNSWWGWHRELAFRVALSKKCEKWFFLSSLLKVLEEKEYSKNQIYAFSGILQKKFDEEFIIFTLNLEIKQAYSLGIYYKNLTYLIELFKR
jgi:hypothetical protein